MSSNNSSPPDPLEALGASLFLHTLTFLPLRDLLTLPGVCRAWNDVYEQHARGIYHAACLREGVEERDMDAHLARENDAAEDNAEAIGPAVDWKAVLRAHVELDRNWRYGRCREDWITDMHNAAWRFKVDDEEGVCMMTTRTGGLNVVDAQTPACTPLSSLRRVRSYAHLEFCKGYAVFDVGEVDLTVQVYRTSACVARSTIPRQRTDLPPEAMSHSATEPQWDPASDEPQPRGHLSYYRSLTPPTRCRAFRARADQSGRAMLVTAGEEAIYIWDLEDGSMERIIVDEPASLNYVEFDDDYIFICEDTRMRIYSHATRRLVHSFPPDVESMGELCAAIYPSERMGELVDPVAPASAPAPAPAVHDPRPSAVVERIRSRSLIMGSSPGPVWPFSACHYTPTDLICGTRSGFLFIVRDYARLLAHADCAALWAGNTIMIQTMAPIELLSVQGTRVAYSTYYNIVFFDTSTLPSVPVSDPSSITLHSILSTHTYGLSEASCLQLDQKHIRLTYWARGETEAGTTRTVRGRFLPPIPDRADTGFGLCIKVWKFEQ